MIKERISDMFNKYFNWGSITRCTLDPLLKKNFKKLQPGLVLDVGGKKSPYKKYIPHKEYKILDIKEEYNPDICCDIHNIKSESDIFDTVIATEVLEHCYNPEKVIKEIYRILKPGGICILSTRFFHPIHADPYDYFRFTNEGLRHLFSDFVLVNIEHHGNRLHCIWKLFCFKPLVYVLYWFNPIVAKIKVKKTNYPLGYVVYAKK